MTSRHFCLAGAALVFSLSLIAASGSQETGDNEGFLVGLLLKTRTLRELAEADIRMCDLEIEANDRKFEEAEKRMSNATETFNDQAIHAARGPLDKARADRKRLKQARARLELARTRAEASYAAVRDLLVSAQPKGSISLLRGLTSLHSGKAKIFRKDGKEVALDGSRPIFLEPGDELMTMGTSSAEAQVLSGRATVLLSENSRLKLEGDSSTEQSVRLIKGKTYCTVESADEFAAVFHSSADNLEADQELRKAVARAGEQITGWMGKQLLVRTRNACCMVSTAKFTIELGSGGRTEITVLDGAVDVGDAECGKQVRLEKEFRVIVTKEDISKPQKIAKINRWWEK